MDIDSVQETNSRRGEKRTSKELLYCEYSDSTETETVIKNLLKGKKKRPEMKFSCSSVLSKVRNFLPELEKAQVEMNAKSPEEYNIEEVDETKPVIEMNLELFENGDKDNASNDESDECSSETSDDIVLRDSLHSKSNSVALIEEIKDSNEDD